MHSMITEMRVQNYVRRTGELKEIMNCYFQDPFIFFNTDLLWALYGLANLSYFSNDLPSNEDISKCITGFSKYVL